MTQSIPYLIFSVGEYRFAIKADAVIEVTRMTALESVPGLDKSIRGIFSLRGVPVYCIDLNCLLGESETQYSVESRIVVAQEKEMCTGFMAHVVHGIQFITPEDHTHNASVPGYMKIPFVRNVFQTENGFLFELNPETILSSENLHSVPDLDDTLNAIRK